MADRKMPTARAGNYAAPVDTTGMDPEMQKTLGIGATVDKPPAKDNPIVSAWKKMFPGKAGKTAAQKSASVKRTSDVPVTKVGQGLQGNRHLIASTGATGGTGSQGHGR